MPDSPEKEILNQLFKEEQTFPITQEEEPQVNEEMKPLIQKVEEEIYLSKPVTDNSGQPMVSSPATVTPTIILPISQNTYLLGLKKTVSFSIRWLAEWCGRIIKIFGSKAGFQEAKIEK